MKTDNKKTEEEVRDAITTDLRETVSKYVRICGRDEYITDVRMVMRREHIQDLAVIIGKALGVVE